MLAQRAWPKAYRYSSKQLLSSRATRGISSQQQRPSKPLGSLNWQRSGFAGRVGPFRRVRCLLSILVCYILNEGNIERRWMRWLKHKSEDRRPRWCIIGKGAYMKASGSSPRR